MNKQQLAAKIWESANKMRSKIEANEYKDYILGFIFYKFLSETEVTRLHADGMGTKTSKNYGRMIPRPRSTCAICAATLSPTTTCSPHGWRRRGISPSPMCATRFPRSTATSTLPASACSRASSTPCRPACPNSAPMRKAAARPHVTSSTSSRTFRWTAGRTTTPSASSMNT